MKPSLLVGGLLGVLWAVASAAPAHAQEGVKNGGSIELPVLKATYIVPAGAGEWVGRKDPGGDLLQRTKPVNPFLSILLSSPTSKPTCAEQLSGFAKKGLRKLDRLALIPAGWSWQILSATTSGESTIAMCAEKDGKALVAVVTYAAGFNAPDLAVITPMLAAASRAVFEKNAPAPKPAAPPPDAKPPAGGGGGGGAGAGAPVPPQDPAKPPPPPPAGAPDLEPQRLSLPETGLLIVVASPHEWAAEKDKGQRDLIRRVVPKEPELKVSVELLRVKRKVGCTSILDQHMTATGKGNLESKPKYLPDTWHENVAVRYANGVGRALACAELPAGYVLATVIYDGSLDGEDAESAKPVLVAVYHGASAALGDAPSTKRGILGGRNMMSPEFFLAGQQIAPTDDLMGTLSDGSSFMLGVRQAGMLRFAKDSAFGLAGRYLLSAGWDSQSGLVLDGLLAIGVGVVIEDRVTVMPMVGTGADAIGTGDADPMDPATRLDFELYNYFGAVIDIEFSRVVGFEGTVAYCDRGDISELRYDGRFLIVPPSFRKVSVGLSHTDIEDTVTLWQVVLGIGF